MTSPLLEMTAHAVEALLVVPAFVKGLEDVDELGLAQVRALLPRLGGEAS